jgi:hypothetical protein
MGLSVGSSVAGGVEDVLYQVTSAYQVVQLTHVYQLYIYSSYYPTVIVRRICR